jgi:hypothetical protein
VTTALWLLGAGAGLLTAVMGLSLCMMAAKPTPAPPGLRARSHAEPEPDAFWDRLADPGLVQGAAHDGWASEAP